MATLYVTEFASTIAPSGGASMAQLPVNAEQTVAVGVASAPVTNAFKANTRIVRLHTDAICSIAFGTAPVATTGNFRMAANQTEYFAVPMGKAYKVANIVNT